MRRPRSCAAHVVIGRKLETKSVESGRYAICLSESQMNHLFGRGRPGQAIGCGAFACAWPKGADKIVKLTRDREDVEGFVSAKGSPHVVKIHEIREMPRTGQDLRTKKVLPVYAIVADRLRPLSLKERKILRDPMERARKRLMKHAEREGRRADRYTIDHLARRQILDKSCPSTGEKCRSFINEVTDIFQDLFRRGVFWQDAHTGNVAVNPKTGRLQVIDLGFSGLKKRSLIPQLKGPTLRVRRRLAITP